MKNIILIITVVLGISVISCQKGDEVTPITNTTKTQNNMLDYYGTYYIVRNVNNLGNDRLTSSDGSISVYEITKDSIVVKSKDVSTGLFIGNAITIKYDPPVTVGDTVDIMYQSIKVCEITKGTGDYDLVIRDIWAPNSSGILWIDHYMKKQ